MDIPFYLNFLSLCLCGCTRGMAYWWINLTQHVLHDWNAWYIRWVKSVCFKRIICYSTSSSIYVYISANLNILMRFWWVYQAEMKKGKKHFLVKISDYRHESTILSALHPDIMTQFKLILMCKEYFSCYWHPSGWLVKFNLGQCSLTFVFLHSQHHIRS